MSRLSTLRNNIADQVLACLANHPRADVLQSEKHLSSALAALANSDTLLQGVNIAEWLRRRLENNEEPVAQRTLNISESLLNSGLNAATTELLAGVLLDWYSHSATLDCVSTSNKLRPHVLRLLGAIAIRSVQNRAIEISAIPVSTEEADPSHSQHSASSRIQRLLLEEIQNPFGSDREIADLLGEMGDAVDPSIIWILMDRARATRQEAIRIKAIRALSNFALTSAAPSDVLSFLIACRYDDLPWRDQVVIIEALARAGDTELCRIAWSRLLIALQTTTGIGHFTYDRVSSILSCIAAKLPGVNVDSELLSMLPDALCELSIHHVFIIGTLIHRGAALPPIVIDSLWSTAESPADIVSRKAYRILGLLSAKEKLTTVLNRLCTLDFGRQYAIIDALASDPRSFERRPVLLRILELTKALPNSLHGAAVRGSAIKALGVANERSEYAQDVLPALLTLPDREAAEAISRWNTHGGVRVFEKEATYTILSIDRLKSGERPEYA